MRYLAFATLLFTIGCGQVTTKEPPDAEDAVDRPDARVPDAAPQLCQPVDCNDSNACTVDTCNGSTCEYAPVTCDDSNACTTDTCDAVTGCNFAPIDPTGSQTFNYSGSIVTFTVPACETTITIDAYGAQGGGAGAFAGGRGARMRGTFTVTPGQQLRILVGQAGAAAVNTEQQGGGAGGGGSFVTTAANAPLVVAGGGGGAVNLTGFCTLAGRDASTATAGVSGTPNGQMPGGTNGGGGTSSNWTGWHGGSGAGGLTGNGVNNTSGSSEYGTPNQPGRAFVNGGAGGIAGSAAGARNGGFGGGGAAGFTGGGGGGYSGGGAGGVDLSGGATCGQGGGGGSYNGGTSQTNQAGARTGNGTVIISW
jgi:hypothetical protein